MWCEIAADRVIVPYFLHDTMNGKCYLTMLKDFCLWPTVSYWRNNDRLFIQDNVLSHFLIRVWLGQDFPGHRPDWCNLVISDFPMVLEKWGIVQNQNHLIIWNNWRHKFRMLLHMYLKNYYRRPWNPSSFVEKAGG